MQSSREVEPLPPLDVLMERFRPYIENKGLMHYRNRTSDWESISTTTNTVNEDKDGS